MFLCLKLRIVSVKQPAVNEHMNDFTSSIMGRRNENEDGVIHRATSMRFLPVEMVALILNYAESPILRRCRQVNRQWNEIASEILQNRADYPLHFEFTDGKFAQKLVEKHCAEVLFNKQCRISKFGAKNLKCLVRCVRNSTHFPVTNFRFDGIRGTESRHTSSLLKYVRSGFGSEPEEILGCKYLRKLVTIVGKTMRILKVTIKSGKCDEILRILLENTPNLADLHITFPSNSRENPSTIRLMVDSRKLEFAKLNALRFNASCRQYPKIMEDILTASPNLKNIRFTCSIEARDFELLRLTNKLHCLKEVNGIDLSDEDTIALIQRFPQCMNLQLSNLTVLLSTGQQPILRTTDIVNQIFDSSKDEIELLIVMNLRPIPELVFPKFEMLSNLMLRFETDTWIPVILEFPDKFPNLRELYIEFNDYVNDPICDGPLKPWPSVEVLRISMVNRQVIGKLMRMVPNVKRLLIMQDKSFRLRRGAQISFEDISTYLPKLTMLGWMVHACTHLSFMHELDALITGLPVDLCKKLSTKFRDKTKLSEKEISHYHSKRQRSSILDLKALNHFCVDFFVNSGNVNCGCVNGDGDAKSGLILNEKAELNATNMFYVVGFTNVSKFLGFDRIPNLRIIPHKCQN
ncbi:uncharacterized protein LOC119082766 [Bradysia coprophila]|uniref:uncharacterized protein LOC119082766 n=1 Tax=Bradysia coprophila TaxID=38358 RepID=UPI00187D8779|nr:uncharacterized protein LOC119082766 [Bradysia coprophila]